MKEILSCTNLAEVRTQKKGMKIALDFTDMSAHYWKDEYKLKHRHDQLRVQA